MTERTNCARCGHRVYATDVQCMSCGVDLAWAETLAKTEKQTPDPHPNPEEQAGASTPDALPDVPAGISGPITLPPTTGGRTDGQGVPWGTSLILAGLFAFGIWWALSGANTWRVGQQAKREATEMARQWNQVKALDGQHISVNARCAECTLEGIAWTGVLVVEEGPLEGLELAGGGVSDGRVGAGSLVRLSGTVHVRGDVSTGTVSISPMVVEPR